MANNTTNLLDFLNRLDKNNNREWFKDNKPEFDSLREGWLKDVQILINEMAQQDKSLINLEAKDCVYRIYRDIRFSPNKLPYKTYMGAVIGKHGHKCTDSCYYLQLEPNNKSGLYGGVWQPEPKLLLALRHAIDDNIEEFESIILKPEFKNTYNLIGDKLKTSPKGFDKNCKHIDYLRFKEYIIEHKLNNSIFETDNWHHTLAQKFLIMQDFHKFMNYTINEEI